MVGTAWRGAALAACVFAALAALAWAEPEHAACASGARAERVAKRAVGGPVLLLVSGVGQSGQAAWPVALDDACRGDVQCVRLCGLSSAGWTSPESQLRAFSASVAEAKAELASASSVGSAARAGSRRTVFVADFFGNCSGGRDEPSRLQYPQRVRGVRSVAAFPDLVQVVRAADEAGLDARVVVVADPDLDAHALAFLNASPIARRACPVVDTTVCTSYVHLLKVMQFSFEVLRSHLSLLDPAFFRGWDAQACALSGGGSLDEWTALPGLSAALGRATARRGPTWRSPPTYLTLGFYMARVRVAQGQLLWQAGLARAQPVVAKRARDSPLSPRPRAVFFAGLEGTGHHLISKVVHTVGNDASVDRKHVSGLQATLGAYNMHARTGDAVQGVLRTLARQLRELAADPASRGKLVFLNFSPLPREVNGLSYPGNRGPLKVFQVPDLVLIAEACEEAGVDLQVVLMTRGAEEIMASVTHRRFSNGILGLGESTILETAAGQLWGQLQALDCAFLAPCFDYNDPTLSFVDPLAQSLRLMPLRSAFPRIFRPGSNESKITPDTPLKQRLRTMDAAIRAMKEQFCAAGRAKSWPPT
jgi:hypothetical protein